MGAVADGYNSAQCSVLILPKEASYPKQSASHHAAQALQDNNITYPIKDEGAGAALDGFGPE